MIDNVISTAKILWLMLSELPMTIASSASLQRKGRGIFIWQLLTSALGGVLCVALHIRAWFSLAGDGTIWDVVVLFATMPLILKSLNFLGYRWKASVLATSMLLWGALLGLLFGLTTT